MDFCQINRKETGEQPGKTLPSVTVGNACQNRNNNRTGESAACGCTAPSKIRTHRFFKFPNDFRAVAHFAVGLFF